MGQVVSLQATWPCSSCGEQKPENEFGKRSSGVYRKVRPACKACESEKRKSEATREYYREYHAKRTASDPDYRQMKRDSHRSSRRKVKYGLPKGGFELLVELQKGRCAICSGYFGLTLRVDHDHHTQEIRGLLCANCNAGIGFLQESPRIFDAAKRYLKRQR